MKAKMTLRYVLVLRATGAALDFLREDAPPVWTNSPERVWAFGDASVPHGIADRLGLVFPEYYVCDFATWARRGSQQ